MTRDDDWTPPLALVLGTGFLLLLVSRWAQLASPYLFEDGDEAIVGVMAQQVLAGQGFPLFFYGQSYAFALVELIGALVTYPIFGATAVSLKLGGLIAWAAGWGLCVTAWSRLCGIRVAALAGALLLFVPAWGRVTMMYTGALVVSSVALWLVARLRAEPPRHRIASWGALGVALGLLYFVHPLWLATVVPFVPFRQLAGAGRAASASGVFAGQGGVALAVGLAVAVGCVWAWGGERGDYWAPPLLGDPQIERSLLLLPQRLYWMLSGHYFLNTRLPMGPASQVATASWCVAIVAAAAWLVWRRGSLASGVGNGVVRCGVAVLGVAGFSLLTTPALFGPRYLLPLTPPLLLAMALALDDALAREGAPARIAAVVAGIVMLVSGAGLYERRHVSTGGFGVNLAHPESAALDALLRGLEERRVRHLYSTDPMLQWNLMYRSRGTIRARWLPPTDRRPELPRAVDRALAAGEPIAMVGRLGERPHELMHALSEAMPDVLLIPPHFFAAFDPEPEFLAAQGFVWTDAR